MAEPVYYDCHAHIEMLDEKQLATLGGSGVRVVAASVGLASFEKIKKIQGGNAGACIYRIGLALHPEFISEKRSMEISKIIGMLEGGQADFIGECGLDPKYGSMGLQKQVLRMFAGVAEKTGMPLQVHSRNAVGEVLGLLAEFPKARAMLHWFSGSGEELEAALQKGYFIGVTPATAERAGMVRSIPKGRLLLETDTPVYGKTPGDVKELYARVAETMGTPLELLKAQIERNARGLFG